MIEEIRKRLNEMADIEYKKFHSSLCPNIDKIIGVRVPDLRKYAKELYEKYSLEKIQVGEEYYEELVLQGMLIGFQTKIKDKYELKTIFKQVQDFVPKINSWAVCDVFCAGLKITKKYKKEMLQFIKQYLNSDKEYEVRFAVVMLLDFYIEDKYIDEVLILLSNIKSDKYYVQMAVAWAYSIGLIKFYDKTLKALLKSEIDNFTYNKAIQKAIESYRISQNVKDELRKLKKNDKNLKKKYVIRVNHHENLLYHKFK